MKQNQQHIFIQRIPDTVYSKIVDVLHKKYHFSNGLEQGGRMRLCNYFVGISRATAHQFIAFIDYSLKKYQDHTFPKIDLPLGFNSHHQTLNRYEKTGAFSFGSYDMAVTENGLRHIESQAIATYPITAAKVNYLLQDQLNLNGASIFVDKKEKDWAYFKNLYNTIFTEGENKNITLTDRNIHTQKTNFEFFATQKELDLSLDMVDTYDIFEKNQQLYYRSVAGKIEKIRRLYNRVLPSEAIAEDGYPNTTTSKWHFRYDRPYQDLTYVNHPSKVLDFSKRLLPYLDHPLNPPAYELAEVHAQFSNGALGYGDFVWKNKIGAAGFNLILSPDEKWLSQLKQSNTLEDYVVQKKVNYQKFRTDDGQEKIIELRFMTAHYFDKQVIVPMARVGHCTVDKNGKMLYKIHFGDNNRMGYGFAPVLVF